MLTREEKFEVIDHYKKDPRYTGGRDVLFHHIRYEEPDMGISRRDVAAYLAQDATHQIHRPLNKRLTVRPIIVAGPALVAQIDLVDMQKLAGKNNGIRYLLTYVDLFSKFVQVRVMKNKTQAELVRQLLDIINNLPEKWRPRTIQSDNGSEFQSLMEKALKEIGIKTIHSAPYNPRSQGAIERFNRTLKSRLFQLMSRNNTERYLEYLPPLVDNINNSKHESTGEEPIEVMEAIPLKPQQIAAIQERMKRKLGDTDLPESQDFHIGDKVRVALTTEAAIRKQTFRKKIKNNWSTTVFEIYSISKPVTANTKPQYLLKNLETNRKSRKKYWDYQLQKVVGYKAPEPAAPMEEEESEPEEEPEEIDERKEPEPQPPRRSHRGYQPSEAALKALAGLR